MLLVVSDGVGTIWTPLLAAETAAEVALERFMHGIENARTLLEMSIYFTRCTTFAINWRFQGE